MKYIKILSLLLCILLLFSGCSTGTNHNSKNDANAPETTQYKIDAEAGYLLRKKLSGEGNSDQSENERIKALEEKGLPFYVLDAIRAYYDLLNDAEVTQEMLDSVTSIRLMLFGVKYTGDKDLITDDDFITAYEQDIDCHYLIWASINDSLLGNFDGPYIPQNRFENLYLKNAKSNSIVHKRFEMFYELFDPSDVSISENERNSIINRYNIPKEMKKVYVLSQDSSYREKASLTASILSFVFDVTNNIERYYVPSLELDMSTLELLKNLEYVELYINDEDTYYKNCLLQIVNSPVEVKTQKGNISWRN